MKPVKVGIIGLGPIGRRQAEVFATEPNSRLVAACDRHIEKRDSVAGRWHCQVYATVDDMLAAEDLDLVSVCTGGHEEGSAHYEPVTKALSVGVNVLVEKPLSNRVNKAAEMVRLADDKDLVLAVNFNHRFVDAARRAREWITEGRLGDIVLVNFQLSVRNSRDDSPYGHLRELHPHSFDLLRYFCGEIASLQTFLARPPGRNTWSSCSINVAFAAGSVGTLQGSYDRSTRHQIERLEISGNRGTLVLNNVYEKLAFYPHGETETIVIRNPILGGVQGFYDSFRYRIRTLLEELQSGVRPVSASGADGLRAQQLVEASIESFETGTIVAGLDTTTAKE